MKPATILLACVGLAAGAAVAQEAMTDDRRSLEPLSSWWMSDSRCQIDAGWDNGASAWIIAHDDHFDLEISDPTWRDVPHDAEVRVDFGENGQPPWIKGVKARGFNGEKGFQSYVVAVDEAVLDRIAAMTSMEMYRDGEQLISLDMAGTAAAVSAMRDCALSPVMMDNGMGMDMNMTMETDANMEGELSAEEAAVVESALTAADAAAAAALDEEQPATPRQ